MHDLVHPGDLQNCIDWFELMEDKLSADSLQRFLILCWRCWHQRNELCFKNKKLSPDEEIIAAEHAMNTWYLANNFDKMAKPSLVHNRD